MTKTLNGDVGVMSNMLPNLDCGSMQSVCGSNGSEISAQHLDDLVKYLALHGVRSQRDYDDAEVLAGEQAFNQVGCNDCHFVT